MSVRLQTFLVFVFAYFLLSFLYDASHYNLNYSLVNFFAWTERDSKDPFSLKVDASYMIELVMSMRINNFFFLLIRYIFRKRTLKENKKNIIFLAHQIPSQIIITAGF